MPTEKQAAKTQELERTVTTASRVAAQRRGRKAVAKKAQALQRLVVEYAPVDSIKPNPYNPNRQSEHEFQLLLMSMEEDGFTQPVIVQRATREIVDGEHRWRAARALGYQELPVVLVEMTPEQMRIATLRHNRARGDEDIQLSAEVLRDLQQLGALDWAKDSLGLEDVELQRLLSDVSAPDALAGEVFSEAWVPQSGETVALEQDLVQSGDRAVSVTPTAGDELRRREAAIAAAKTEEEKAAARRDADVFRVILMYSGEEGKLVKEALGNRPAVVVLEMCRERLAAKTGA